LTGRQEKRRAEPETAVQMRTGESAGSSSVARKRNLTRNGSIAKGHWWRGGVRGTKKAQVKQKGAGGDRVF